MEGINVSVDQPPGTSLIGTNTIHQHEILAKWY